MKNKVFITLVFVLFYFASFSQTNYFVNTYNGFNYRIIDVNVSGIYVYNGSSLFKTDPDGTVIWAKSFNQSGTIKRLYNGDFLIVGHASPSVALLNLNVIRIDSLGNIVWSKNFNSYYTSNSDVCIEELSSHNLIIGFANSVTGNGISELGWISIDENGLLLSSKSLYLGAAGNAYPIFIKEYSNGDLLVLKHSFNLVPAEILAMRIRPNTDSVLWSQVLNGEYANFSERTFVFKNDVLNVVSRINDNNNPPYGYNSFSRIAPTGMISVKSFGTNPSSYNSIGIYNAIDDGFFATRANKIFKLDSLFNIEWQKEISNSLSPSFYPVATFNSSDDNIYISFDKFNGTTNVCCLIKADSLCNSACGIDSSSNETLGPLTLMGFDSSNLIIDSLPVLETNFVGTSTNVTITRNVICTTALEETDTELLSFDVFPNPTVDHLTISKKSSAEFQDPFNVSIFNAVGKCVLKKEKIESSTIIDTKNLSTGMYLILITTEKGSKTYKILKN